MAKISSLPNLIPVSIKGLRGICIGFFPSNSSRDDDLFLISVISKRYHEEEVVSMS